MVMLLNNIVSEIFLASERKLQINFCIKYHDKSLECSYEPYCGNIGNVDLVKISFYNTLKLCACFLSNFYI